MQRSVTRLVRYLCLSTLVLCLVELASANQSRNFAATYHFSDVSETGNDVQLTVTLTIHNYSGEAVRGGGVVLYNEEPTRSAIGAFNAIKSFPNFGEITQTQRFTVSKWMYLHWQQGRNPELGFLMQDAHGAVQSEHIDLSRDIEPVATE